MLKIKVLNMHCMSCVRNIEDALTKKDQQIEINPNLDNAELSINTILDQDEVISIIKSTGYKCELINHA
ncbi:MAG: heavy-metal-associated domain-containing protein [Halobacteriovoraceae bacterium]|nr:heavy-metal-associated domain-containing protein [Halobacteriovoraceae bacterium]